MAPGIVVYGGRGDDRYRKIKKAGGQAIHTAQSDLNPDRRRKGKLQKAAKVSLIETVIT